MKVVSPVTPVVLDAKTPLPDIVYKVVVVVDVVVVVEVEVVGVVVVVVEVLVVEVLVVVVVVSVVVVVVAVFSTTRPQLEIKHINIPKQTMEHDNKTLFFIFVLPICWSNIYSNNNVYSIH